MPQPPIYQKIAEDLRKEIESGCLERGGRLPTQLEIRERYHASRNATRDAIRRLVSMGLVESRPGRGAFVRMNFARRNIESFATVLTADPDTGLGGGEGDSYLSQASAVHRAALATTPQVAVQLAPATIAAMLRASPHARVVSRRQARYIDGIPWSLQTSFYPAEFVFEGAMRLLMAVDIPEGTVRYLADAIGVRQIGYRDWITARRADGGEQKFFRVPRDAMMFEIFRTAFDQNKTPMRVTVTVSPTDRNQFIANAGDDLPGPEIR